MFVLRVALLISITLYIECFACFLRKYFKVSILSKTNVCINVVWMPPLHLYLYSLMVCVGQDNKISGLFPAKRVEEGINISVVFSI